MSEPFDVYANQFLITLTPFGANLSFRVQEPHPSGQSVPASTDLGTIRMSIEHLKTMIMMMRNQVRTIETQSGVRFEVPTNVLAQLNIAPEDWDAFWR